MTKYFFNDTAEEFIQTFVDPELNLLRKLKNLAKSLLKKKFFLKRPFVNASVIN